MRVHHLNCGTMAGGLFISHVLLIETGNGLVLVDTGFGLADTADPGHRLGPLRHLIRPVLDPEETAARQVERLGLRRADVRHIIVTHLYLDHIGGLADFPRATVHLTAAEAAAAAAPSVRERIRYRRAQLAHNPHVVEHTATGERWRGFAAAKELDTIAPGIVLVPLPGHTRGHTCVGVDAGHRWVLHAGDAFYHPGTVEGRSVPAYVTALETTFALDPFTVRDNHSRLAELHRQGDPNLLIVCAHSADQLRHAQRTA